MWDIKPGTPLTPSPTGNPAIVSLSGENSARVSSLKRLPSARFVFYNRPHENPFKAA